ncbi:MAG: precorrin-2 dehydrogenase/sirohydrochlorin ferrochelatase family protein [Armatimonadota bacterium]
MPKIPMHCYQIALLLENRPCLVVGAGRIAERKIGSLLEAGGIVCVVARQATPEITALAASGRIALHLREYAPADLDDMFVVIVATDDADLNGRISTECQRRGILVNVVDQPSLCSFYVPAVIERGPISIAISSSGASPALTKHLRVLLEKTVGEEYGLLSTLMQELRGEVKTAFAEQHERAAAWERLLQSEVLALLRDGEVHRARQLAREVIGLPPTDS